MIYLDSAATTSIYPEVLSAMEPYLKEQYGNPSSHYSLGMNAKQAIENAREVFSSMLGCHPLEVFFTSGGSESNSWAIKGLLNPYPLGPIHIITDSQEHHSLLNAITSRRMLSNDIMKSTLKSTVDGLVDHDNFRSFIMPDSRVKICSIQTVNNETGIIQPIQSIAFKCKEYGYIFHTDAVQAFGHLELNVDLFGIDMLSASSHKIHGPKGVGLLYISDKIQKQMVPLICGGQQEKGLRGSTENVAGIVGFAKAAEIANANMTKNNEYVRQLASELVIMLSRLPGVHTNVNLRLTDYRHISIRLDGIRAEEMLSLFDSVDICISSGSACNSDSHRPSHVLKAIGLSDEEANSTIRVSIDETNTIEELMEFVNYLQSFLEILRGKKTILKHG